MRVLIVEDEPLAAQRLVRLCRELLGPDAPAAQACATLDEARDVLAGRGVELVLLDLHLTGDDGFELLTEAVAGAFHTVVVSANGDQALRAYELGVLDFVPKPYTAERLGKAFARVQGRSASPLSALAVRKPRGIVLVSVADVSYVRAAGDYSDLVLRDGRTELSEKSLERLQVLLPSDFLRIHRSHLARVSEVVRLWTLEGSRTEVQLRDGTRLPVGRSRVEALRTRLGE
ncbi:LytTR family DNA-binding domain-containing protein [Corallococcus sp. bb12-1]|uniref:LytR/AlgR family response regulator transcription factor n=1 Tax=Corallococcus sp. bb12-1 TaxID=2996784 RepID=UPI00226F1207|nr:LytTR family DNA-binding domain-containing protein [Corallococcus sp. bb12-1]MCY1041952.1 LytTR family DNA-binding domain-containing protein [Corallococcus sp. bb12-1]